MLELRYSLNYVESGRWRRQRPNGETADRGLPGKTAGRQKDPAQPRLE